MTVLGLPPEIGIFLWQKRKERAYLVYYKDGMRQEERRRCNSWDDSMREWCRRDDFHNALPLLLHWEDPDFQCNILRVADQERGGIVLSSSA